MEKRQERFDGLQQAYNPSDPEMQANLSEKQREYLEPGGPWSLKDISGRKYTHNNLRGKYYMLYFGHTLCPDITPLTVHKMTKVVRKLNKSKES